MTASPYLQDDRQARWSPRYQHQYRHQFVLPENEYVRRYHMPSVLFHGMLKSYRKNMQASLQRNSDLLSDRVLDQSELPTILDAFFRINAHGELINATHLENICRIAEHNPHCNVAVWTKRKDIVSRMFAKRAKPSNLILIWSNPKVDAVVYDPPKHFDRVFNNVSYEHKPDEQNCTGSEMPRLHYAML
jgi:hypothetical protein